MTEGDGIRRNVAYITPLEKQHLRDAIKALNTRVYPPSRDDFRLGIRDDVLFPDVSTYKPAGGVSYWFKQDEIHRATHVHHGPAFLTWHREFCNRFETLLRSVNPNLSLHYWDWTMDPNPLFTSDFMGSASGPVGEPWESAGFYKPLVKPEFNRDKTGNYADPSQSLERSVGVSESLSSFNLAEDNRVIYASTYKEMSGILEDLHDIAHPYIGGTIGDPHTAFRDPFVFLLHSNVDRLFAMWQLQDPVKRLNPDLVYGEESCSVAKGRDVGILTPLEPWAGVDARMYDKSCKLSSGAEDGVLPTRPWAHPENEMAVKNSKHISVVTPPVYDTSLTPATGPVRKMHTKEIEAIRPWMLKLVDMESKVPDKIPESKVLEQMPTDVGLFTERIDHIEERLATMESFIRPYERPRLDKKDNTQLQNSDENQTGE